MQYNSKNIFSPEQTTKPVPVNPEIIEKLITRVQIGKDPVKNNDLSKKSLNESLTNLRHDLR